MEQLRKAARAFGAFFRPAVSDAVGAARVFPDTNLALHWKRLDEIDWLSVTGASQVQIEIAPVFLRELEQQKVSNKSKKLRDRAKSTVQWLSKFIDMPNPVAIRDNVVIVFGSAEPSIDLAAHKLSERVADDILIASALDLARRTTDPVGIATGDLGLRAKLLSRPNLMIYNPPEEYRLPDEVDAEQKELNELRAKIARMEAQRPLLKLTHKDEAPFLQIERGELQRVEALASIQERFPLKPPSEKPKATEKPKIVLAGLPWVDPSEAYNERVKRFWNAWEEYERADEAFCQFIQRSFYIELELFNEGGKPATDIDVYVTLPEGVTAISNDNLPKVPEPPKEPKEGVSFLDRMSRAHDLHMPWIRPFNDGDADIDDDGKRIRFSASKLKHDFHLTLQKVVLAFDEGVPPFSFEADYKVSCAETHAVSGQLRFVVKNQARRRKSEKNKK